jgi:hypothetical protein
MTARIQRSFDFQSGIYFTGDFYMNMYEIDLCFNVETESIREQNIALDRIKYFLSECLEHSIIIDERESQAIEKYLSADIKVCTVPEEPYDQIIGIMLMLKLNSIAEGRLSVTDVSIGSRMSDGVSCMFSIDDTLGPFAAKGWWNDSTCKMNNYKHTGKNKKIVKLIKPSVDWDDLYMGWEQKSPFITTQTESNEVIFSVVDKTDK